MKNVRCLLVQHVKPTETPILLLQVKIIKCLVDNIVVDISFNQLGGLCTLCFLEEVCFYFWFYCFLMVIHIIFTFSVSAWVIWKIWICCPTYFNLQVDNLINQNHLFKRSIILIKAWCYYESRILGAHHGLISTYALETLVLYTFHVFNNSFAGPLEVSLLWSLLVCPGGICRTVS